MIPLAYFDTITFDHIQYSIADPDPQHFGQRGAGLPNPDPTLYILVDFWKIRIQNNMDLIYNSTIKY